MTGLATNPHPNQLITFRTAFGLASQFEFCPWTINHANTLCASALDEQKRKFRLIKTGISSERSSVNHIRNRPKLAVNQTQARS
jgi:hypothetical protein